MRPTEVFTEPATAAGMLVTERARRNNVVADLLLRQIEKPGLVMECQNNSFK